MAKSHQNLLDIMDQLLLEESEPLCRQVASVFQRFRPESATDLQAAINDYKYGAPVVASLEDSNSIGQEFLLNTDHFKKKVGTSVAVPRTSNQQRVIHSGIEEDPKPLQKMPTAKFADVEEMMIFFDGMKLKDIKKIMNENGLPIHGSAQADSVLEVLNDSIK